MPNCPFCDHENAAGAERCQKCGAWMADQVGNRDAIARPAPNPGPVAAAKSSIAGELPPDVEAQLVLLLKQQRKIDAIKLHRKATGSGLKEAKDAVEAFAASRGIVMKTSGCLGVLVIVAIALALTSACVVI